MKAPPADRRIYGEGAPGGPSQEAARETGVIDATAADAGDLLVVVDDDRDIRELLSGYLVRHGFQVHTAANGHELDQTLAREQAALVVLDLMLPGEDGLQICRRLRVDTSIPVIILTGRGETLERIIGLEMGADDYLAKPFDPRELVARIRAVLSRARGGVEPPVASCQFAGWRLDLEAHSLQDPAGRSVDLSVGEFNLLRAFVENPRRALDRDQLLDLTQGREFYPFDRSVDVQVSRLRKKLARGGSAGLIKTVHGVGYLFTAGVARQ